ncbi:hypothetical protein PAXRUDRAFT_31732 [Paxillus rubicundulus Ve08.2h10]|uniref:Uncharacterized protein n=1 Tax=Paxillus rubicundulus Ve08.2h10 TaxID=930991 RepID=A0A0D0E7B7_9AGAM|nr:hypothetical protein PAXRUDRAFT_31732 [Paxillus rubicundulus Ve08.2h10]
MNNIPALPSIEGDLILDVLTRQPHRNMMSPPDNSEHGGSERLAGLGESVLDMVVVYTLFQKKPPLSAAELSDQHHELLDDQHITQWLSMYSLKARVRGLQNPAILDRPDESRLLFNSYVGAVYVQKGLPVVVDWISRLVCPDSEALVAPGSNATNLNVTAASSPPPYSSSSVAATPASAPPPPMPAAQAGLASVNALSLFNQTCSQRGLVINWDSESEGPPHQPRWAVKCLVNGTLRGSGTGRNQKVAKEEAARQAFHSMGWGTRCASTK